MKDYFSSLSPEKASMLLDRLLIGLKQTDYRKVKMKEVQQKIRYNYLSRARNYETNRPKRDDGCFAGRHVRDVLYDVLTSFNVVYNPQKETFSFPQSPLDIDQQRNDREKFVYLMYYHTETVQEVNCGIVRFFHDKVVFTVISPINSKDRLHWSGTYSFSDGYLMLDIAMEVRPSLRATQIYSYGLTEHWHPIFIGGFCGVRHDGAVITGRSVLIQVDNEEEVESRLNEPVPSPIHDFVKQQIITTPRKIVNTINELSDV